MTRARRFAPIAMLALCSPLCPLLAHAAEYRPALPVSALKYQGPGASNAVLVVGTPHLSGLPDSVDAKAVAPLVDRLATWRPDAIATEDLSGLQCHFMRQYPSRYAQTVETYCPDTAVAGRVTGLGVPAANAEAEKVLAHWPAQPSAGERRHLAALFLAAGEPNSAVVQWLRLPEAERHAGDGLDDELAAMLAKRTTRRNESIMVAAVLAARLGLERVWSVDDHTADTPDSSDPAEAKAAEEAITKAWNGPAGKARRGEEDALLAGLGRPGGLMAIYRAYNAPAYAMTVYKSDFGAALTDPSPQGFGRQYVGYWETRNLRMVSNIRDVLAQHPGKRLLAIVGASHKPYYEAYLDQMHDVRLTDAEQVLR